MWDENIAFSLHLVLLLVWEGEVKKNLVMYSVDMLNYLVPLLYSVNKGHINKTLMESS